MITSNDFQGQTNGATVTTSNSANSGTAFTGVFTNGGTIIYDNSQGGMAMRTAGLSATTCFVECTNFANDVEISVAFDYYLSPTKTANRTIFQLRNSAGIVMSVLRNTGDTFSMTDAGGAVRWTSTTNYNAQIGDWVRIELQVLSDAANGTLQMSVFPQASTTPIEAGTLITGRNTRGGAITTYRMGKPDSTTDTQPDWFDNIRSEDAVLKSIGPTPIPPSSIRQNTAEGGTNGVTVSVANSGGASGDAFSQVTITGSAMTYFSNNTASHGSLSYRITGGSGDTGKLYIGNTASSEGTMRGYFRLNTLPSNAQTLYNIQNTAFASMANINITSGNLLTVTDSAGTILFTSSQAVTAATWYRVELQVIAGATATTGTVNFQYYVGDSTTAEETSSTNTANTTTVNAYRAQLGKINSGSTLDANFDSFAYAHSTSVPIGPYSAANALPTCSAGNDMVDVEPWTLQTLVGADNDPDGTIAVRAWRQISGSTVTLSGTGSTRTYTAPGTLAGTTLVFGYQVTDDQGGLSVEDTVTHIVLGATDRAVISGVEVPMRTGVVQSGLVV